VLIRCGWRRPLAADCQGEGHLVLVRCEPAASPWLEWCDWEERKGRLPAAGL
jgi:hypothetical protein